jgi:predicted MFS family arabinose efflux permease
MKGGLLFQRRLWLGMAIVLAVVMSSIAATVGLMYRAFDASIAPLVLEKAGTAGRSLSGLIGQAAAYEIPIEKLVGVEELFADTAREHPEIARIELSRMGKGVYTHGPEMPAEVTTRLPVPGYESSGGEVAVSIDPKYIRRVFQEMSLDLLVVAVVTLFISLELLYFLAGALLADLGTIRAQVAALTRGAFVALPRSTWLGRDLSTALGERTEALLLRHGQAVTELRARIRARHRGGLESVRCAIAGLRTLKSRFSFYDVRGARGSNHAALILGAMRAPFLLLLLADDLSRSFLPLFAAGLAVGPIPLSSNLVASLPIFVFMLVVALSQPVLGGWSERIGRRRSFLAGASLACLAHLFSAQASSLLELLVYRSVGGAAWAIAFVAAQGYILDHTDAKTRTAGLAAFVGIIMVSMICGPSIGGILADGIGYRATLALGAVLTLSSFVLAWRRLPPDRAGEPASADAAARATAAKPRLSLAFANRRFLMLLLLAAVPAKLILIAYCYFLIPLYIVGVGSSSAMAGRLIMLYSVMMVLLVPLMANWVVSLRARHAAEPEALFVAIGLGLSGLAGLAMALPLGLLSPLIVVLLLGIGQSLSISPQAAMVAEVCKDEIRSLGQSAVYGVYRMVERMGNAVGPVIAAVLLELGGFQTAFIAIGAMVLLCALLFAMIFLRPHVPLVAVPAAAD